MERKKAVLFPGKVRSRDEKELADEMARGGGRVRYDSQIGFGKPPGGV